MQTCPQIFAPETEIRQQPAVMSTAGAGSRQESAMRKNTTLVVWQDSYALGLEEIDRQHKMLFDIMNRLWAAILDNAEGRRLNTILEDLEHYTVLHFTEEETFMRSIGYPDFDGHVAYHQKFVRKLMEEKEAAHAGRTISLELIHFLRDWLVNHILVEDKRYAAQFRSEQGSSSLLGRFFARRR